MRWGVALSLVTLSCLSVTDAAAQAAVGGFVEFDHISYFQRPDMLRVNGRNQGILQLEVQHSLGRTAAFGAVEIRNDQDDPSRNRVFLDEAYVALYLGRFDIRAGKQIYAWGRADAINPTDNLSAWDYSDVLDTHDEKLGAISLRVDYYVGPWTLEGVLVPSFVPSVLPPVDSRWWPSFPDSIDNPDFPGQGPRRLGATYRMGEAVRPDEGLPSTQYAIRLSGTLGRWDVALSWFDGIDDLPGVRTSTTTDLVAGTADVVLEPQYDRRRAIGADVATTVGPVGLHAEGAYYLTADWNGTDPVVDDPFIQYVVGGDYTFDHVLAENDLFVLLEWVQEVRVPDRGAEYRVTDLNHVFRRSLFAKADLDLGEFASAGLEVVWNLATHGWLLRPKFTWSVTDGVEVDARLELLGGPPDSFFGTFRHNRRLQARLKYSF